MHSLKRLVASEEANSIVEYGMIVALLSALLIASFTNLRTGFVAVFTRVVDCFGNAVSGRGC